MIKRVGNIAIMVLLLIATGGIPVTRHYCGPAEMSFSVYSTPKSCCKGPCDKCHNVFKFTKVNDAFEAGTPFSSQLLADVATFHAIVSTDLFDNLFSSPFPGLTKQRNFLIAKAGHSPASLGTFRC